MRSTVQIGPFAVDDLSQREVVETAIRLSVRGDRPPSRAYALHVGGLNHRTDGAFVAEMVDAELVYADGGSIVGLARLSGARVVERSPTTDIGWDVLRGFRTMAGRPARVALIGGPPGLAERAGQALESGGAGDIVFAADGFQSSWDEALARLADAKPDICVVGMGAPREMMWVKEWRHKIDCSLVLTCGGWFGFLAGEESRAPTMLRRSGLEWVARVAQSPRRLGGRYALGAWSTAVVASQTIKGKWFS